MKFLLNTALLLTLACSANSALAACDAGEIVIKFSHVTNTDKHPKGIAATLLEQRVNDEMNGKACLEVFPNSTLYNDNQVLEALLQGDVQLAAPSLSKFEQFTKQKKGTLDIMDIIRKEDASDSTINFLKGQDGKIITDLEEEKVVKHIEENMKKVAEAIKSA